MGYNRKTNEKPISSYLSLKEIEMILAKERYKIHLKKIIQALYEFIPRRI